MVGGKVALVTGAGQRVGRAIAEALAADGWRIGVHYRSSRSGADEAVAGIRAKGGEAEAFAADLSEPSACDALVDAVYTRFDALDLLVNSAAGMEKTRLGHTTAQEFDAIIALNLRAPFLLAQAAARLMPAGSAIVNIADHMTVEPWPDYSVHGIAKAGVIAMTRHLAAALAPDIRVNAIIPGPVMKPAGTSMSDKEWDALGKRLPLKRTGTADDVARAAVYLASEDFITGAVIEVDGGEHLGG